MSKVNILILLLLGFILYKGFNFNKKITPTKTARSATQKKFKKSSLATQTTAATAVSVTTTTQNTASAEPNLQTTEQSTNKQREDFDSLNDLNQHIEGIPVENAAVPVEKLTPAEMEQYQISLYEQKLVSETGTVQITPEENKEGEP